MTANLHNCPGSQSTSWLYRIRRKLHRFVCSANESDIWFNKNFKIENQLTCKAPHIYRLNIFGLVDWCCGLNGATCRRYARCWRQRCITRNNANWLADQSNPKTVVTLGNGCSIEGKSSKLIANCG